MTDLDRNFGRAVQQFEQMQDRDAIDSRRALADQRKFARENRAAIDAEWDALTIPPRTIAGHLAAPLDPKLVAEWER